MPVQVWLRNIQNLLKRGMEDAAQKCLEQSLLSLPRSKHVKVITQVAIMEFKIGSPERARSIFEGVVRNYPRRTDLWSVYLDQVLFWCIFLLKKFEKYCARSFESVTEQEYLDLPLLGTKGTLTSIYCRKSVWGI